MKKVYFIGFHKTGSTSLQWFLSRNQWRLARAGILFPPGIPRGLGGLLSRALDDQGHSNQASEIQDYMGHNALAYRLLSELVSGFKFPPVLEPTPSSLVIFEAIKSMLQGIGAKALVLCSEDLARLSLLAPQGLRTIRDQFGEENVRLQCTIRRPDEAIVAWQSQAIKGGHYIERLEDAGVEQYLTSVHFDYQNALAPWLDAFPQANLQVDEYQGVASRGGSVANFIATCGLELPEDLQQTDNRNTSLHPALFELVRLATRDLGRREAYLLRDWLERKESEFDLPHKSQIEMLGQANRERLFTSFRDIHVYLSELAGKPSFFPDLEAMLEEKEIRATEATSLALPSVVKAAGMSGLGPDTKEFLAGLCRNGV